MRPARLRKICDITKKNVTSHPKARGAIWGGSISQRQPALRGSISPRGSSGQASLVTAGSISETGGSRRVYLASLVNRRGLSAGDRRV